MTNDGLVDITEERERAAANGESSSTPYVIQDSMDATWHPVTGEYIDSKSRFRQRTRDAGCEELGNEKPKLKAREDVPGRKEAILKAFYEQTGR